MDLTNVGAEPVIPEGVVALLSDSGKMVGKAPFAAQRLLPGERLEFARNTLDSYSQGVIKR